MLLTRRELCSVFPAALLPALLSTESVPAQQNSLLSAMYPFESLPVQTEDKAQFRSVERTCRKLDLELFEKSTSHRNNSANFGDSVRIISVAGSQGSRV
jgi:hypothetical protein